MADGDTLVVSGREALLHPLRPSRRLSRLRLLFLHVYWRLVPHVVTTTTVFNGLFSALVSACLLYGVYQGFIVGFTTNIFPTIVEDLLGAVAAYHASLETHALLTKALTSCLFAWLADLIAQHFIWKPRPSNVTSREVTSTSSPMHALSRHPTPTTITPPQLTPSSSTASLLAAEREHGQPPEATVKTGDMGAVPHAKSEPAKGRLTIVVSLSSIASSTAEPPSGALSATSAPSPTSAPSRFEVAPGTGGRGGDRPGWRPPYDWRRAVRFSSWGLAAGVMNHAKYQVIESGVGSRTALAVFESVCLDQLLFTPPMNCIFIVYITYLATLEWSRVRRKLNKDFLPITLMGFKMWPLVNLINFAVIPLAYRVFFINIFTIVWNCYLSFVSNRAARTHPPEPAMATTIPMSPAFHRSPSAQSDEEMQTRRTDGSSAVALQEIDIRPLRDDEAESEGAASRGGYDSGESAGESVVLGVSDADGGDDDRIHPCSAALLSDPLLGTTRQSGRHSAAGDSQAVAAASASPLQPPPQQHHQDINMSVWSVAGGGARACSQLQLLDRGAGGGASAGVKVPLPVRA